MKKVVGLLMLLILLVSCEPMKYKEFHSNKIYLRQLVNKSITETHTSGMFFLVAGSINSDSETQTIIKVMGEVDGEYRFMQFDFLKVRIKIDNKVTTPYIVLNYDNTDPMSIDEILQDEYNLKSTTIVCPEQYLPERLLPIEL